jgi:hypothetical protein
MSDQMVNGDGLERLKKFDKEVTMNEVSYKYNIGFQEMVQFYQKASSSEVKKMESLIKNDNWNGFKKLIKDVLGIQLKG